MTTAAMKISLGISGGFFILLLVGICWLHCRIKRRKYTTLERQKISEHNRGLLRNAGGRSKIFTSEQLNKATNDFNESEQISEGMYRGILSDKTVVAIKKLDEQDPPFHQAKYAVQLLAISTMKHRNVATLLGCCEETPMPLLVYKLSSNGTLYEHIHKIRMRGSTPFSLYWRIKAAAETAAALAYLHSSISKRVIIPQILNTRNILFDDHYMVKLLLAPGYSLDDEDDRSTLVQVTIGYLDPQHIQSSTITEKSNVYSFGVVLAELLTSQKAFNYERPEAERMLAKVFARAVKDGTLHQILDDHEILKEGNLEMVEKVADLAIRCLRKKRADRPSMKQVAMELEGLRIMAKHSGGMLNFSESPQKTTDPLVTPSDSYVVHVRGEGFDGGSSSAITNAQAMGCRLQQVDYYST